MTGLTIGRLQRWIPLFHVLVLCVGTVFSFLASTVKGDVSVYLPFISETGAYSPGKSIFSFFLIIGSFIGCIMVILNYIVFASTHENEIKNFIQINISTCILGLLAMIGLAGVAAFPMTTIFWMHLLTAILYFLGSALYFLSVTFISMRIYGKGNILLLRYILSATIMVLLIFMMFIFPISLKNWHEKHEIIPAIKEPHHDGFTLLLISSLLEWCIGTVIITFNLTFIKELKKYQIILGIIPEVCENESNKEVKDANQSHGDDLS